MTIVIDASALAELLLGRPLADAVERAMSSHGGDLHAPHLIDVEVISVLRRLAATGAAAGSRADDALIDLLDLPIERYPHDILAPRVWELRENFTAYDAVYVALAEALKAGGVPLLTADHRLARAVRSHARAPVLTVG